jgi:hypothetical protein
MGSLRQPELHPVQRLCGGRCGDVMSRRGRIATDTLTLALLNLAERGERTHCSDPGASELWISDRSREAPESAQAA